MRTVELSDEVFERAAAQQGLPVAQLVDRGFPSLAKLRKAFGVPVRENDAVLVEVGRWCGAHDGLIEGVQSRNRTV